MQEDTDETDLQPKLIRGACRMNPDNEDQECDGCGESPHSFEFVRYVGAKLSDTNALNKFELLFCDPCARLIGAAVS